MAELKITLKRSVIGRPQNQKDTAESFPWFKRKINSVVVRPNTVSR